MKFCFKNIIFDQPSFLITYGNQSNLVQDILPDVEINLDCPGGVVVSMSDNHPRGPGFDSRLYFRNFSGNIWSGIGST